MSETVRDAVFGNVGSIVAFRSSPDDAPILGKQFEPTFEPGDLVQMHNRNFIINMVINGEKADAFNARTLTLPIPQDDNTGRIIENTRRLYSRPRAEIEKEISDTILPPENLLPKKPANKPTGNKWEKGIKPVFDNKPAQNKKPSTGQDKPVPQYRQTDDEKDDRDKSSDSSSKPERRPRSRNNKAQKNNEGRTTLTGNTYKVPNPAKKLKDKAKKDDEKPANTEVVDSSILRIKH